MKKHKKSKINILRVVLSVSLVTGVALFGIYTSGILEGFIFNKNIYEKKEDIEREEEKVKYIIQYVNTSCGHNKVEAVNSLPEETFGENYLLEMGGGRHRTQPAGRLACYFCGRHNSFNSFCGSL